MNRPMRLCLILMVMYGSVNPIYADPIVSRNFITRYTSPYFTYFFLSPFENPAITGANYRPSLNYQYRSTYPGERFLNAHDIFADFSHGRERLKLGLGLQRQMMREKLRVDKIGFNLAYKLIEKRQSNVSIGISPHISFFNQPGLRVFGDMIDPRQGIVFASADEIEAMDNSLDFNLGASMKTKNLNIAYSFQNVLNRAQDGYNIFDKRRQHVLALTYSKQLLRSLFIRPNLKFEIPNMNEISHQFGIDLYGYGFELGNYLHNANTLKTYLRYSKGRLSGYLGVNLALNEYAQINGPIHKFEFGLQISVPAKGRFENASKREERIKNEVRDEEIEF